MNLKFDFDQYPYLSSQWPGLGGNIRQQPADFQVSEVAAYTPSGEGEHLMFYLEKEGLTTRAVFEFIRDRLHISEASIGVAGLKDKWAVTRQWLSVPAQHAGRLEGFAELPGVRILEQGLHPNKLRIGHLRGNRFKILIRNLEGADALGIARHVFERLSQQGVPNYYGPQRFGIGGLNAVKGYELATKGKIHSAPWLKKFLMSSLQSLLYNDWVALRMERGIFDQVITGDVAKKHDTGGEFVVEDGALENPRALRFEISAMGPLHGKKHREAKAEARLLEDEILARYALDRRHFGSRRGDRRSIRFPLEDWSLEAVPEGLWVGFFLPKGAYATAVLRELMKKNPEARGEVEGDELEESAE